MTPGLRTPPRRRAALGWLGRAGLWPMTVALGLAACHPTDQPPIPPPKPTNPTNGAFGALAQESRAIPAGEIIDASIVIDGSVGWDASGFRLDKATAAAPGPTGSLTTSADRR
jgi:hypothetical protein